MKTQCGSALYRSPEQLGLLPREFRACGNSYTSSVDIWALGAIVHQMLTLEIPFLDTYQDPDMTLTTLTTETAVDMDLLHGYCRDLNLFPCSCLRQHGISEEGINFVKSLMVVNPSERPTAAWALKSEWLIQSDFSPPSPETVLP